MHRWLLVILVLLLPLRGLAGAVMGGQMLEQRVAAVAGAGHDSQHAGVQRALHDCDQHHAHAHAPGPAAADDAQAGAPVEDCPTCASCQVCSAVVLAPAGLQALAEALPQVPPQQAADGHASAEPARALKPPQS